MEKQPSAAEVPAAIRSGPIRPGAELFFRIVSCRWPSANEIQNGSFILRDTEVTDALGLSEERSLGPHLKFAVIEFFTDPMIERALQHDRVSIVGM